jgi:hypothetical protein
LATIQLRQRELAFEFHCTEKKIQCEKMRLLLLCCILWLRACLSKPLKNNEKTYEMKETIKLDFQKESDELIKTADMLAAFLRDPSMDNKELQVLHNRISSIKHFNKKIIPPIDNDYNLFPFEKGVDYMRPRIEQAVEETPTERVYYVLPETTTQEVEDEDYDYHQLKHEFYDDEEPLNDTILVPLEEKVGETVAILVDFSLPKNCSAEERNNIGMVAIECLISDLRHSEGEERHQVMVILSKVLFVWLLIMLVFLSLVWCQTGKFKQNF